MAKHLLVEIREHAARSGLNLFGIVDAERFDDCQPPEWRVRRLHPSCGTILVLGSGGRALSLAYLNRCSTAPRQSVDSHAQQAAASVVAALQQHGLSCRAIDLAHSRGLSAPRLGEAAGFGTVSPVVGVLLHPQYGPWLRVRTALLFEGQPFGAIADAAISETFQPCCNCSRPCVAACPAGVHDGHGHTDIHRCAKHRLAGGCEDICATRAVCPVGTEHRDAPGEAAHRHGFALATTQRWFGFGVWRLLPRGMRPGP